MEAWRSSFIFLKLMACEHMKIFLIRVDRITISPEALEELITTRFRFP